ncbi:hypothetical protein J2793_007016 [Paraburkholderia caledonica]|uniref:Uncharacterized protein n=1 Tax=Paraburkholderia caledonica TaxID=134536 RepID=A0AB73INJ6_9BURK|nr:hypothetical protein [Paraburkholderia caledonica]
MPGTAPVDVVARVNYLGLRHLCEALLPRLAPGGNVINVASILGAEWPQRLGLHRALAGTGGFDEGSRWLAAHPVPQATCYQYFKEALPGNEARKYGRHLAVVARTERHRVPSHFSVLAVKRRSTTALHIQRGLPHSRASRRTALNRSGNRGGLLV